MMTKTSDLRAQTISLEPDGIVRMRMRPGVFELELSDAREIIQAVSVLCGGVPRPALVDLRELRSMSRDCRRYFAGPETATVEAAAALLILSPITRAIGNFFMGINKTLVPTRLFTSEAEAIAWLRGYVT